MIHWQPGVTLADVEKQTIELALRYTQGNKVKAAHILGVSSRTIYNKLHSWGMMGQEEFNGLQEQAEAGEAERAAGQGPEAGARVQPAPEVAPQRGLPVRKQKKIQAVSP